MTTLTESTGIQLQLTSALLQVDSRQYHTVDGQDRQVSRTIPELLSLAPETKAPSRQFIVSGNENLYHGIKIGGSARAHIGNSFSYPGVPKASVDIISMNLDELATSRQADTILKLLQDIQTKQSDGCVVLSGLDTHTQQSSWQR